MAAVGAVAVAAASLSAAFDAGEPVHVLEAAVDVVVAVVAQAAAVAAATAVVVADVAVGGDIECAAAIVARYDIPPSMAIQHSHWTHRFRLVWRESFDFRSLKTCLGQQQVVIDWGMQSYESQWETEAAVADTAAGMVLNRTWSDSWSSAVGVSATETLAAGAAAAYAETDRAGKSSSDYYPALRCFHQTYQTSSGLGGSYSRLGAEASFRAVHQAEGLRTVH